MFSGIEMLINKALASDARTPERLKKLQGKTLEIKIKNILHLPKIMFTEDKITFIKSCDTPPAVIISGPLQAFLTLAFSKNTLKAAQLGLRFEGDLSDVEAIQQLFLFLEIDWEEMLSDWSGDTIAHQIGNVVRSVRKQSQEVLKNVSENTSLYLTEETKLLPTKTEITRFIDSVDHLRAEFDRLEARVALL